MATVHEKNWISKANIELPNDSLLSRTQAYFWNVKQALIGATKPSPGAWTIIGSSNGSTYGMDGVDRWTTYSDIKPPNSKNQIPWMVLASPGPETVYLLISWHHYGWSGPERYPILPWFMFSREQMTGGSTTIRPSINKSHGICDTDLFDKWDRIGLTGNLSGLTGLPRNPHLFHFSLADDGSFIFLLNERGTGVFNTLHMWHRLADAKPTDPNANVFLASSTSSGTEGFGWSSSSYYQHQEFLDQYVSSGTPTSKWTTLFSDGTSPTYNCATPLTLAGVPNGRPYGNYLASWMQYDKTAPTEKIAIPLWIAASTSSTNIEIKGRLPDVYLCPAFMPYGTCEPSNEAPMSITAGPLWLPMLEAPNMA